MESRLDSAQCLVIGAGLLGASIAYGLARIGTDTLLLDEGDSALRATRGNFGLVWVQNKGAKLPEYAAWSRDAANQWPQLAKQLQAEVDIDVSLKQPGGFCFCFSDEEVQARSDSMRSIAQLINGDYPFEILTQEELRNRIPEIGSQVVGASFTPMDGHVNPLKLYRALDEAGRRRGVRTLREVKAHTIKWENGIFKVSTSRGVIRARHLVLAAGLGNIGLAPQVGLYAPVIPSRGQILVTERVRPFLSHPTNKLRQTDEGSVQIGDSVEDVGFDDATTTDVMQFMARRAASTFPLLKDVNIVRAWGALRVMTPDGFPVYEQSKIYPGAFVVTCHSGVTLAAMHALTLAPWIAGGAAPKGIEVFESARLRDTANMAMYVN